MILPFDIYFFIETNKKNIEQKKAVILLFLQFLSLKVNITIFINAKIHYLVIKHHVKFEAFWLRLKQKKNRRKIKFSSSSVIKVVKEAL